MTFEYHALHVSDDWLTANKGGDATTFLTDLGKVGWDIATTIDLSDGSHIIILRQSHSN